MQHLKKSKQQKSYLKIKKKVGGSSSMPELMETTIMSTSGILRKQRPLWIRDKIYLSILKRCITAFRDRGQNFQIWITGLKNRNKFGWIPYPEVAKHNGLERL